MRVTEELRERLFEDTGFWAEYCARIVNASGDLVPLEANRAQSRFDAALEAQREAGQPMRAIVLKARKLGFSTWVQAKIMHRITQRPFRRALVVAQDNDTAGALFEIGDRIWANLPDDQDLSLKPPRPNFARGKYMHFKDPSRLRQSAGAVGLDSRLEVDTAREVEAGRGYTFTELHCSEVAFWPDVRKLTSLLNAVPDQPETMIVLESTANSLNHFHERWQAAEAGESGYVPIFAGWTEEPSYVIPFPDAEAREEFISSIGTGEWGEDEPMLQELYGCTAEQLHWRRRAIIDKAEGKLDYFKQEYPVSPDEAFQTSGKHVFSQVYVGRMRRVVEHTDPKVPSPDNPGPEIGQLQATDVQKRKIRSGVIEVPRGVQWVPQRRDRRLMDPWRIWEMPDPGGDGRLPGAYIVSADPAGGEENEKGDLAWHAIQVINHRSKAQVAEWRSRIDPDQIAEQLLLAALFYNRALIVPEVTGGYGGFIARRVRRDYGYPLVYRRRPLSRDRDVQEEPLGWSTTVGTKPYLEGHAQQLLRDGYGDDADGDCAFVRSRLLAGDPLGLMPGEFATYVQDERGRTGPLGNAFSDLLMAWMIAEYVAHERPVPMSESRGRTTSTAGRRPRDPVSGW